MQTLFLVRLASEGPNKKKTVYIFWPLLSFSRRYHQALGKRKGFENLSYPSVLLITEYFYTFDLHI